MPNLNLHVNICYTDYFSLAKNLKGGCPSTELKGNFNNAESQVPPSPLHHCFLYSIKYSREK